MSGSRSRGCISSGAMAPVLGMVASFGLAACGNDHRDDFVLERINPDTLARSAVFSQVTTVSGDAKFVFVAGQTDRAPDVGGCRHDDWRGQIIGVRENVENGLAAAGATWDDVVFIRRYVVDIPAYLAVRSDLQNPLPEIWQTREPPPSTLIQVSALAAPCYLVEIDVFAVVPADD